MLKERPIVLIGVLTLIGVILTIYAIGAVPYGPKTTRGFPAWTIKSSAFLANGVIPKKYTADGTNVSPALNWTIPPQHTVQLALICNDPDAPNGNWIHWVVYGMPPSMRALPGNAAKTATVPQLAGMIQGVNSFGTVGYSGPEPPPGKVHHYHFVLYALDAPLKLKPRATYNQLTRAMRGHILKQTELVGTYSR